MTPEKLKEIIARREGTEIEFKLSKENLARSVYESKNPTIANVFSQTGIVFHSTKVHR